MTSNYQCQSGYFSQGLEIVLACSPLPVDQLGGSGAEAERPGDHQCCTAGKIGLAENRASFSFRMKLSEP
jgi:hypothetical protein